MYEDNINRQATQEGTQSTDSVKMTVAGTTGTGTGNCFQKDVRSMQFGSQSETSQYISNSGPGSDLSIDERQKERRRTLDGGRMDQIPYALGSGNLHIGNTHSTENNSLYASDGSDIYGSANPSDRRFSFSTTIPAGMDMRELSHNKRTKTPRDPMSHRIIEKRRRDRMNNCLADLSKLIPKHFLKQGQGRIEKTEIIELAIRHICHLQELTRKLPDCEREKFENIDSSSDTYAMGYDRCIDEVLRYFQECKSMSLADPVVVELQHTLYDKSPVSSAKSRDREIVSGHDRQEGRPRCPSPMSSVNSYACQDRLDQTHAKFSQQQNSDSGVSIPSGQTQEECESPNPSTGRENYSFKNYLKSRFTADLNSNCSQSTSSRDEDHKQSSTPYPSSSSDSSSTSGQKLPPTDSGKMVPGFALHPSGTHYIPIVYPLSHLNIPNNASLPHSAMLHPISIPVQISPSPSMIPSVD
ncbi:unnamed protein product [Owenia fusiformis]|uniref:Uncharacterized protein n=1 Tax=Owenia fusiformis TaxID=6347 RepID=A0A8J1T840_OWEFU|nr:unnamed protein product [Owenia fusiformis]